MSLDAYPRAQSVAAVATRLREATSMYFHEFWPDEISALDPLLREIPVQLPATEPALNAEAFKAMLLPHAAAAYAASKQAEFARHPERMATPRDLAFHLEQALHGAAAGPNAAARMLGRAAQWLADLHARGR